MSKGEVEGEAAKQYNQFAVQKQTTSRRLDGELDKIRSYLNVEMGLSNKCIKKTKMKD